MLGSTIEKIVEPFAEAGKTGAVGFSLRRYGTGRLIFAEHHGSNIRQLILDFCGRHTCRQPQLHGCLPSGTYAEAERWIDCCC